MSHDCTQHCCSIPSPYQDLHIPVPSHSNIHTHMHTHKLSVSSSIHHHWENRSLFRNTSCSHDQYCQPSSSCPHILCHYVTVGEATQSHHFSPFSVPFHLLRSSLFSLLHHLCLPPQFQQNTKAILTLRGLQASLDSTAASGYPLFLCPLVSRNS